MTSAEGLHNLGVRELAHRVAEGEVAPSAIAVSALARIAALDGSLHAWVWLDREATLAEAEQLDREAAAGRLRGPLHGVPVGVKDIFDVAGMPTKAGSRVLAEAPPASRDSAPVAALRRAGALILGKTATTEFASADPAATVNPWNAAHTPGGSSSGSAAAVAARMAPAALGSQTAGSVLRPAAFCGVTGLKPSFGRIRREGVLPFAWSLDTMGTFSRGVADAALLLSVLTRQDWSPAADDRADDAPPRLGYLPRLFPERLHPHMSAMLRAAAATFAAAGASVAEATLPADFGVTLDVHHVIMTAEGAAFHARTFGGRLHLYGPRIRALVESGMALPAVAYLDAQRVRADLLARLAPLLAGYDALLLPAAAGPAPEGLDFTGDTAFNGLWTMFGLPAITLPGDLSPDGLPLGLQLVGRPSGDEALLRVAAWCEAALGLPAAPPW